jgi:hypothetical protein
MLWQVKKADKERTRRVVSATEVPVQKTERPRAFGLCALALLPPPAACSIFYPEAVTCDPRPADARAFFNVPVYSMVTKTRLRDSLATLTSFQQFAGEAPTLLPLGQEERPESYYESPDRVYESPDRPYRDEDPGRVYSKQAEPQAQSQAPAAAVQATEQPPQAAIVQAQSQAPAVAVQAVEQPAQAATVQVASVVSPAQRSSAAPEAELELDDVSDILGVAEADAEADSRVHSDTRKVKMPLVTRKGGGSHTL